MDKEKKKWRPSLKITLTAAFLLFSAVLLIALWIFQTVFLDSFYKTIKTTQVRSCAHSISENIASEELSDLITDVEEQNSMAVSVYRVEGKSLSVIYRTERFGMMSSIATEELACGIYDKTVAAGGEFSEITQTGLQRRFSVNDGMRSDDGSPQQNSSPATGDQFDYTDKSEKDSYKEKESYQNKDPHEPSLDRLSVSKLAYAIVTESDVGERLVVVESEITPVTSVVETLRFQLIILTAVLIVISIVIALITASKIAKPISLTNEKAKQLAKQNYDVEFKGDSYQEIRELNATLNYSASELKKVDALRRELISNISHDLRTPLTMITGYSEVMRDLPGEMTPQNIQIIIDESSRLSTLVSDLLDLSKLEAGASELSMQPFSLTRCISSIFSRYTKLIESDGYNISFEYDEEVFVNGDELKFTQVLYNLINNAINHAGEDKAVIVRQTVKDGRVRIDVIDHGIGIPEDKLPYIWDRYYRANETHTREIVGTGLGLSIVKNILKAHGAEFSVISKEGEGSDFYFILDIIQ